MIRREDLPLARAIDVRRLVEIDREGLDARRQDEGDDRQVLPDLDGDDRRQGLARRAEPLLRRNADQPDRGS